LRSERVTKMLKTPPKAPKSEPKSRSLSVTVLSDAVGTIQPVEKVVVGPVGGPKELEKQGQNPTITAFSAPEPGAEESAKEFSTRWIVFGT
jgi:hypothetical protein